jgi:DNA polymerase V
LGRVYKIKKTLEDTIITGSVTHVIHTVKES